MQRIVEFRKLNFWSGKPGVEALNKKISELNKDGWYVQSVVPNTTFFGVISSYTLLLQLTEQDG
ncbi:hypothetical protein [Alteromonas halophila]|uniref:DUF4177 domain-containing protein n=1 Tax=Alteromonas halophila TaxID=516698 RepID=A0A918JCP3_9ALTE|nr:hypothetical protein [Alteromonas halophila]GGW74917.1 hypothetical protein GCM10007391_03850 [Alteromonas halophila]